MVETGEGGPRDRDASNRALEKGCELGDTVACSARSMRDKMKEKEGED